MPTFTSEHDTFRRMVRQFVDNEIQPYVDEWERAGVFPAHDLFAKLGELGLLESNTIPNTEVRAPTTSIPRSHVKSSAASMPAALRWPSACRPTWRHHRSIASAAMN